MVVICSKFYVDINTFLIFSYSWQIDTYYIIAFKYIMSIFYNNCTFINEFEIIQRAITRKNKQNWDQNIYDIFYRNVIDLYWCQHIQLFYTKNWLKLINFLDFYININYLQKLFKFLKDCIIIECWIMLNNYCIYSLITRHLYFYNL